MELTFSHECIKKKIYRENDYHRISTENLQKTSEFYTQLGRAEGKREREQRKKMNQERTSTPKRVLVKRKGIHTPEPPNWLGDQPEKRRILKASEKSASKGLRRANQRENCTDHWYHHPGHHSLRYSGRVSVLKLRLWRSVMGRGLLLAV